MATKDLEIKIGIVDAVSGKFREISKAASSAAKEISSSSDGASSSLRKQQSATEAVADASKRYEEAGRKIGLGLAALGGAFTAFSSSLVDNQRQLSTLERNYGTTAESLRKYADQLQRTTTFSSESAIASANIFSSLARNFGFTSDEIENLISLSADLAATSGMGLVEVSERVAAGLRGETEGLEILGIALNQNTIDREGLTLSMTNEEAAHFRLNALMAQSTASTGAAAEAAQTTAGRVKQLANSFSDMGRDIAAASGPIAPMIAGLAQFGLANGAAVAGLISLGKGVRDFISASGGFRAALSTAATFIGPGGLLVAGLGLAAIVALKFSDSLGGDNLYGKIQKVIEGGKQLDLTIAALTSTMTDAVLGSDLLQGGQFLDGVRSGWETLQSELVGGWDVGFTGGSPEEYAAYLDAMELNQLLIDSYGSVELALDAVGTAQTNYENILRHQGAGQPEILQRLQEMIRDVTRGFNDAGEAYTSIDFFNDLQFINDNLGVYDARGQAAIATNQKLAESIALVSASLNDGLLVAIAALITDGAPDKFIDMWLAALPELQFIMDRIAETVTPEASDQTEANIGKIMMSGNEEAIAILQRYIHEVDQGYMTTATFVTLVGQLANDQLPTLQAEAVITARETEKLNQALDSNAKTSDRAAAAMDVHTAAAKRWAEQSARNRIELEKSERSGLKIAARTAHDPDPFDSEALRDLAWNTTALDIQEQKATRTIESNRQAREKQKQALRDYLDAAKETAEQIGLISTDAQKFQLAGVDTAALNVAVNLQVSQSSLETVNRVIVGNTNQLSQQMGGIKSWADTLIGDPGVWADMDRLLADNRISQEEYDAAQKAQISISQDVANAQEDILAIQTKLAPVIADATRQQAEYIDSLQDQDQATQLAALGYMDQAESSKAMQLAQLVAMSTTDDMRKSTELMVQQIAASDPVMKAMLIDMGLLNEADGTVNFDTNAVDVGSAVEELTKSIDALIELLGGVPPIHINADDLAPAKGEVDGIISALGGLDGSNADPNVTIQDNASEPMSFIEGGLEKLDRFLALPEVNVEDYATGKLLSIAGQLAALDTKRVTTFVDTIHRDFYESSKSTPAANGTTIHAFSNGGTLANATFIDVPHYMTGGSHAIVGERGPELVWLPNGSQVTNTEGSRSRMQLDAKRRRSGGDLINRGTIIVQPASVDIEPAVRRKMLAGSRK